MSADVVDVINVTVTVQEPNEIILSEPEPLELTLLVPEPTELTISTAGAEGRQGPQGEPGPASELQTNDPEVTVSLTSADPPTRGQAFFADGLGAGVWSSLPPTPPPTADGDDTSDPATQGLLVLGSDDTDTARFLRTDQDGVLQVHDAAQQAVLHSALADVASALAVANAKLATLDTSELSTETTLEAVRVQAAAIVSKLSAPLHVTVDNQISEVEVDTSLLATEATAAEAAASLASLAARTAYGVTGFVTLSRGGDTGHPLIVDQADTLDVALATVPLAPDAATASGVAAVKSSVDTLSAKVPTLTTQSGDLRVYVSNPVDVDTSAIATEATLSDATASLATIAARTSFGITGTVEISNQPDVSALSLDASTQATTAAVVHAESAIVDALSAGISTTVTSLPAVSITGVPHAIVDSGTLAVTQSGAWSVSTTGTTDVSGSVSITGTPTVSAAITSLPSITGAVTLSGTSNAVNATLVGTPSVSVSGVALDGTLTSGSQKSIQRGGAKGSTTAADVTSTSQGTDHQAIDVTIYASGSAINPTQIRALTSADVVSAAQSGAWSVSIAGTPTVTVGNSSIAITAASLPLPSGAATSAKQPALGTAGTASADVLTVQGIASMTALKVDGSAVTQPISGTVTVGNSSLPVTQSGTWTVATSGTTTVSGSVSITGTPSVTVSGVALDATLTGGSQVSQLRSGAKGTSSAALVTSTAEGSNNQALDVQIYHGGTAINPTAIRALTSADVVSAAQSGSWSVGVTSSVLPTGASTETTLAAISTKTPALGQATMAASSPVVIASNQSSLPVTIGNASLAVTQSGTWSNRVTDGTNTAAVKAASTAPVATDPALVVSVSPNSTLSTTTAAATTGTRTSVSASASSVQLLASNASRKGYKVYNDSTAVLYLAEGSASASTTSYTVQLVAGAYYEASTLPLFTGVINGIWSSATGNARITELT